MHSEDNKADKVIETTINKDTETPRGLTGFRVLKPMQ